MISKRVINAWEKRTGPGVLSTMDADGTPNSIWVGNVRLLPDRIEVADSAFFKTLQNLRNSQRVSFLFLSEEGPFQIKGQGTYLSSREALKEASEWADTQFVLKGILQISPEMIYQGAEPVSS